MDEEYYKPPQSSSVMHVVQTTYFAHPSPHITFYMKDEHGRTWTLDLSIEKPQLLIGELLIGNETHPDYEREECDDVDP